MRNPFAALLTLLCILTIGCGTKPAVETSGASGSESSAVCICESKPTPQTPIQKSEAKFVSPFEEASRHIISSREDLSSRPVDLRAIKSQTDDLAAIQQAQNRGDIKLANDLCQSLTLKVDKLVVTVRDYKQKSAEVELARRKLSLAIDEAIVAERESRETLARIPKIVEAYKGDFSGLQNLSTAEYIGSLHRLRINEAVLANLLDDSRKNLEAAVTILKSEGYNGSVDRSRDPTWEKLEYTEGRLKPILETLARSRKETEPFFDARRSASEKAGIKSISDSQLTGDSRWHGRVTEIEDVIAKRLLDEK